MGAQVGLCDNEVVVQLRAQSSHATIAGTIDIEDLLGLLAASPRLFAGLDEIVCSGVREQERENEVVEHCRMPIFRRRSTLQEQAKNRVSRRPSLADLRVEDAKRELAECVHR